MSTQKTASYEEVTDPAALGNRVHWNVSRFYLGDMRLRYCGRNVDTKQLYWTDVAPSQKLHEEFQARKAGVAA